eukprot:m.4812 g.4812  ORF g.4812 m.4812 type:complete len:619 (-) comp2458_c0_seq1:163-2019(-)
MSWISGITSRAEDLLNQVDQAAADRLRRDAQEEYTAARTSDTAGTAADAAAAPAAAPEAAPEAATSENGQSSSYANTTPAADASPQLPRATRNRTAAAAESSSDSAAQQAAEGSSNGDSGVKDAAHRRLVEENKMLKNEIEALQDEVNSFSTRIRDTSAALQDARAALAMQERNVSELRTRETQLLSELGASRQETSRLQGQLTKLENEKFLLEKNFADTTEAHGQGMEQLRAELEKVQRRLSERESSLSQSSSSAQEQLQAAERELVELRTNCSLAETQAEETKAALSDQVARNRQLTSDVARIEKEFSEYKTKASRILQTKEKIIGDLKKAADEGTPLDSTNLDLVQLQREKDALDEELNGSRIEIETLHRKIQELEEQCQSDANWAENQIRDLESSLKDAQAQAEQEADSLRREIEELNAVRDETFRQKQALQVQLSDRDAELQRTKSVLTRKEQSNSQSELENRLHSLTENLIEKQSKIEALSSEKTALSMQLEAERRKVQEAHLAARSRDTVINVSSGGSSWEDGGGRIRPLSAMMAPDDSDSGMTRNFKVAVNCLDKFSIRLGVFLRRYPIARIFVICYMALLHTWVMIVLLTYTPEMHNLEDDHHPVPPPH